MQRRKGVNGVMEVKRPSETLPAGDGHVVAIDTEGSGLHVDDGARISIVSVAWHDGDRIQSLAYPFDQGPSDKPEVVQTELFGWDQNLSEDEWRFLIDWASRQRLTLHNAKHDLHQFRVGTRKWEGQEMAGAVEWDTMLFQSVAEPTQLQALEATALRLGFVEQGWSATLDANLAATKKRYKIRGEGKRYDLADWGVIGPYAAADTANTLRLRTYQQLMLDVGEWHCWPFFQREMRALKAIYAMEARGIPYDVDGSWEAAAELQARADRLRKKLPFNTLPQAKRWFFEQAGEEPMKRTEKGAPQLDDETIDRMVDRDVKWAAEWRDLSKIERAISMWYGGYPEAIGPDGRLRTNYRQTRVKSGRMSVERVQLHAIPKNDKAIEGITPVKELFQAKPGHVLVNLDMSQAELRVATSKKWGANCTRMRELLADGADLHGITTEQIFDMKPGHPEFAYKRDIAKRLTFGGIFQIGGKRFQATLAKLAGIYLPLGECEEMVAEWRRLYPEFGQAYYRYMKIAEIDRRIQIVGHEWSYFGPRDYPNSAWNRRVQGSLAKANKIWLTRIEEQWPGALVLNVHDSAVLELPIETHMETAEEVAADGAEMLTRMFRTDLDGYPMRVDISYFNKREEAKVAEAV